MKTIQRIQPMSVVRITAIVYGVLGLLEAIVVAIAIFSRAGSLGPNMPQFGPIFGVLTIVFLPVLFAALGAIAGGISAAIYNVAAKYVGGIQVEVE